MEALKCLAYQNHSRYDYGSLSKKDFEWAVELNRFSLELIGLWPKSKQNTWEKPVALIIHLIANDWTKTTTFQEKAMMIAKAQIARIIVIFGYGIMGVGMIIMFGLPLFGFSVRYLSNVTADLEKPFPIQTYYIYDTTRSPQYELTYAVQYSGLSTILFRLPDYVKRLR
ncbi:PREDICTED: uncharacterized protein LOC105623551 [Atta cephalotes]|uniref:Uncharacterized protein n=1 Tax=Atta cephalotes TaxID=12957 RepID=A0A158NS25_ATTCE|nr:PREDICTED: uncharacterized protein LOC105623551 [Atta cephalotes]